MTERLKLHTTTPHHEALWSAANKVRQGTQMVSVPVASLKALLMDHGRLLETIGPRNYVYPDPQD